MTYDSEVLADSPWGYWKQDESASPLADSSGNSRPMTVTGSPTYAQPGPGGFTSIAWTNVVNQRADTAATVGASVFTHTIWVYLTATPAANVSVMARAAAYGDSTRDGDVYVGSDGIVRFTTFSAGGTRTITAGSALTLNTWHHVTASIGAAGMVLRVDKVTVASDALYTSAAGVAMKVFIRGGGAGFTGTSPVRTARAAYFTTQLSTARTDAHFDAMGAGGGEPAEVDAASFTFTALDVSIPVITDTSNKLEGFQLGGYVMNEAPDPLIAELPPIWTPTRSDDMALYLPPPTIVDGRIQ